MLKWTASISIAHMIATVFFWSESAQNQLVLVQQPELVFNDAVTEPPQVSPALNAQVEIDVTVTRPVSETVSC